jgi:hypothetical protein
MVRIALSAIHVDLSPERITLRADGQVHAYTPVLHILPSRNSGWRRVLVEPTQVALGGDPLTSQPAESVPLFSGGAALPPGLSKADCLERFFRLAFKRLVDSYVFRTKPRVELRGLASLDSALAGYQRELLIEAMTKAGAGAVNVVD